MKQTYDIIRSRYIGFRSTVMRPVRPFLSDASLLVLIALADGEKHGYAIQADIEEFSGVELGPGTLYVVLPRLEEAALIEPLPAVGRRRPYRLTETGRAVLQREVARTEAIGATGRQRLAVIPS